MKIKIIKSTLVEMLFRQEPIIEKLNENTLEELNKDAELQIGRETSLIQDKPLFKSTIKVLCKDIKSLTKIFEYSATYYIEYKADNFLDQISDNDKAILFGKQLFNEIVRNELNSILKNADIQIFIKELE